MDGENVTNIETGEKFDIEALTKSNYWDRLQRQKQLLLETEESKKK